MKLRGGSFGLLGLLVVLAIVLVLVAKNWQAIAPTGLPASSHGEEEAAEAVDSGGLPNLEQAQESTDDHTEAVNSALEAID